MENNTGGSNIDSKISPALICSLLSVLAAIGIMISFATHNAVYLAFFLIPVIVYEIIRTEGVSTTFSSWMMLVVVVAEIIFILFGISYDIGKYLEMDSTWVGGQYVPLGDIKILGPALLAVFSLILVLRTAGPYTKWLGIIIFIAAFFMVYIISPVMFKDLLRSAVQSILWYF